MFDVLAEIVSAIAPALFGTWWYEQSQLTQVLIWVLIITIIGGLVYLFFPGVLGLDPSR